MRTAADDIKMVESWGYTQREALEMVTRRAVFEARRIADDADSAPDRATLERHLAYLDELRSICLAASADSDDRRRAKRGLGSSIASAATASAARTHPEHTPARRR